MDNKENCLSKEVCKECYRTSKGWKWTKLNDKEWDKNIIRCVLVNNSSSSSSYSSYDGEDEDDELGESDCSPYGYGIITHKGVPIDCPYQLEHMMETQNEQTEELDVYDLEVEVGKYISSSSSSEDK